MALTILSLETRNASVRQRKRLKRKDVQSLAIENELSKVKIALHTLRKGWNRIEKFENLERKGRKLDKPAIDKRPGQNIRYSGTYGKK